MDRRKFIASTLWLSAGMTMIPANNLLANRVYYQMEPIRRNVGIFTGRGGTIGWYADSDSVIIVDAQFPPSASMLHDEVRQYSSESIHTLINTHHHADHTAGNTYFRNLANQIVAHENVPDLQRNMAELQNTVSEQTYADVTFNENWILDAGSETIHVIHYGPAHTSGDAVVWFENANIVHMGDLVFNRWYPFIDINNGASITNWIQVLDTVADQADSDTVFIFGHGSTNYGITGTSEDLIIMKNYLTALLDFVDRGIAEGKNLEEIINHSRIEGFSNHVSAGARLSLRANIQAAWQELNGDL
jgi:cyclase